MSKAATEELGFIEISAYPCKDTNVFSFYATADKITIDWGDGCIDTLTPNETMREFSHKYATQNLYTVRVSVEGLTEYIALAGYFIKLKIENCLYLNRVDCNCKKLTTLDIGDAPALTILRCRGNELTSLDVSKYPALINLDCSGNKLTSLNLDNPTLIILNCSENQLTSLDVSKCTTLIGLECNNNRLSADALNELFHSLHSNEIYDFIKYIWIDNNLGRRGYSWNTPKCDVDIAEDKGWQIN